MNKYRLLKMNSRSGRFYAEDIATGLRQSLHIKDREEADDCSMLKTNPPFLSP